MNGQEQEVSDQAAASPPAAFLISRLYPDTDWSTLLEQQEKRILGEFYTRRGIPRNPHKLVSILEKDERQNLVERFHERLQAVMDRAVDCIGGYGEFVSERLADLGILGEEARAADQPDAQPPEPKN
jgi:hypothetical protein